MENLKERISKLVLTSHYNNSAKEIFKDDNFELQYFERNKDEVLDDLESRLLMNKQMGNLVHGLEEAVYAFKHFNSSVIVTNLISREKWEVILYTDVSYSMILGLI